MKIEKYKVQLTFVTPLLGSQPGADTPAADFVRAKAAELRGEELPDDERIPDLDKGTTGFYRMPSDATVPCLMDYQIKGMLKESGAVQNGAHGVKNLRSKVGSTVFVRPRHIPLVPPPGGGITYRDRPLRAMTMQGPRTSLARSEELPAGTTCEFEVHCLNDVISEGLLHDLFAYGEYQGLGQWRSGGNGSIDVTIERV